jgi:hypothetical protein
VKSNILLISPSYRQFEGILPDDLIETELKNELETARDGTKRIIKEDLENIKSLSIKHNKTILFNEFRKPDYIVQNAFYLEGDVSYDDLPFRYAHWTMCLATLEVLTQKVIDMSVQLKTYYTDYVNADKSKQKNAFIFFVSAYQDFYGFLISIHKTIEQYHDSFVLACNQIDSNNKEQTIYAGKSDMDHRQLLDAVKELLLRGNWGRLAGFALSRSALEVFITRKLFDPKNSKKYYNNKIEFPGKGIPTPKAICGRIDELQLGTYFKTDTIRRLYDWQSIVAHRGLLTEEYLMWFVYYVAVREVIVSFNNNLDQYGDQILDELRKVGQITIT